MSRNAGIGLDRRLDIEWLDTVAAQVASAEDILSIRSKLFDVLDGKVSGGMKRGTASHKTVGVLLRTWAKVPEGLVSFRDNALRVLPSLTRVERMALHWAILIGGFAFFGDAATNTGRLLALQGNLTLSQLTRRMRETWGERSTMNRATQRVVRSMVQWGGLADTESKGVYTQTSKRIQVRGELTEVLIEALLIHEGKGIPVDQALSHPALFPFRLNLRGHSLRQSSRFEVHRQGLDEDVVNLVLGNPHDNASRVRSTR